MSSISKADVITLKFEQAALWLTHNWQQVAIGLGALFVGGILAAAIVFNLQKVRDRAWDQLSYAQAMARQGKMPEALSATDQLLNNTRYAPLVTQTQIFRGDVLITQRQFDEAQAAYEEALKQAPTLELQALAAFNLAFVFEQSQQWPEAEEHYYQFVEKNPDHFLTARAQEGLGRVQMIQNKWAEAQNSLERLITLFPSTKWAQNAQSYLGQVKFQLQQIQQEAPAAPAGN